MVELSKETVLWLNKRGIARETLEKLNKYSKVEPMEHGFKVFTSTGGYITYEYDKRKHNAEEGVSKGIIGNIGRDYVFIVEGLFDLLSFLQYGYHVIALNGLANWHLTEELSKAPNCQNLELLLCLDNDAAGQKGTAKLKTELIDAGFKNIFDVSFEFCKKEGSDPNNSLVDDKASFENALQIVKILHHIDEDYESSEAKDPIESLYGDRVLDGEIQKLHKIAEANQGKIISTGFEELDRCLGGSFVNKRLALIGNPGSGKSCLAINIAYNLLKQDQTVVYYSNDMQTKDVLFAMVLLRMSDMGKKDTHIPTISELTEEIGKLYCVCSDLTRRNFLLKAINETEILMNGKFVIVDNFSLCGSIEKITELSEEATTPITFIIDFIQEAKTLKTFSATSAKDKIDYISSHLQKIHSLGHNVIGISSVSKEDGRRSQMNKANNFQTKLTITSMKESGSLEYIFEQIIAVDFLREENKLYLTFLKNRRGNLKQVMLHPDFAHCLASRRQAKVSFPKITESDLDNMFGVDR